MKPENIVLRGDAEPVLVDFGLAARRIRPLCLTGPYGAPEVWSPKEAAVSNPASADIYSFGCVAYELLTSEVLFQASTTTAQILAHAIHDGAPPGIEALSRRAPEVGSLLRRCLRRQPRSRTNASALRAQLGAIAKRFQTRTWPL